MADPQQVKLGAVQETLFIPLAARARETRKRRPILRDPKAVHMVESIDFDKAKYGRGVGGMVTTLRTAVFDVWVRNFLAANPDGTVIEIGAGLNARFERVDNGTVRWIDLDLPDTIELRRQYFADTERRQMVAASVLDEAWFQTAEERPPPYFFAAEGVLVYLAPDDVTRTLARIAERFPGALMALDTYSWQALRQNHRMAARHRIAPWQWGCDDPRSLEPQGLGIVETATITRPPALLRRQLPPGYRYLLPLADPLLGRASGPRCSGRNRQAVRQPLAAVSPLDASAQLPRLTGLAS